MKITDNYYVLVRLGTTSREAFRDKNSETMFIYPNDEIGTDIKSAMCYANKSTADICLADYEGRKYDGNPSGFVPLLVTREYTF